MDKYTSVTSGFAINRARSHVCLYLILIIIRIRDWVDGAGSGKWKRKVSYAKIYRITRFNKTSVHNEVFFRTVSLLTT